MNSPLTTTIVAGALTMAALGSAGLAVAAPSGPSNVATTINVIKADGFDVIVNRVRIAPLSACAGSAGMQMSELKASFVGRGVFVDVAAHQDVPYLSLGTAITADMLDATWRPRVSNCSAVTCF